MTDAGEPQAPRTSGSLAVGDVVADRYRVDAVLGEGGMGIVYRAQHLHLRKPLALKVLLPLWSSMPEVAARFEREAVAAGRIQDPHVATATDFGRLPDGSFFLVMEYVNGRTLREVLQGGALDPPRALHVLRGVVSALQAAHAVGIVHRDMKPENIMLIERDGDPDFVKVLDFGIAKIEGFGAVDQGGTSKLTQVGAVIGTPDYMSPEQAFGQPVDARSDLYSVGVIFFEMLTGRAPFSGGAVTVLRQHVLSEVPDLPPEVTTSIDPRVGPLLRRLLAKLPQDRFADTAELTAALEECSNERAQPESPPSFASVEGITTSAAQRVRTSVLAGLAALEGAARRSLADPRALLAYVTQRRLMILAIGAASAGTMLIVLVVRTGTSKTPSSAVSQATTDSAASVASTSGSDAPPSPPEAVSATPSSTHVSRLAAAPKSASGASPSPAKPAAPSAKPPSSFIPTPTPASPTPADSCTPPYRIDFFGNKVPKPGCR